MLLLGSTQAGATLGSTEVEVTPVTAGPPYEAFVTGTMPTDKVTYQPGTLDIYDAGGLLVYSHTPNFRGRGNTTWAAPKQPFKVRSLDRQQTPFNFPASRDWALMADYFDDSYIRSTVAYEIARRATGRWAPLSRHVRLTWNGVYQGLYRYSETADVQAGRVDIREMEDTDTAGNELTGPYFLEVNNPLDDAGWVTPRGTPVLYDVPDVAGTPAQETYIQGWVAALETALVDGDEAAILPFVDLPSWVDWYLLSECTKSMDTDWQKSCKWVKDQDAPNGTGKAMLWPPWDYDLSLGISWGGGAGSAVETPTGWNTRTGPNAESGSYPNWLYWIWEKSPTFRNAVRDAWAGRFLPTITAIDPFIEARSSEISPLVSEDRAKWKFGDPRGYFHETAWIQQWITDRAAWITANL